MSPCRAENIPEGVDMVLMGSSAALDQKSNSEIQKALSLKNIPIKSFAEILGDLTKDTHNIVVTGSYGKSSISGLLSYALESQGISPSYFIGAVPIGMKDSAHIGNSKYFILEGDEYPHDIDSLESKFLFYNPRTVLLTSGEHDHINKFPTIESYTNTYKKLLAKLPKSEGLVVCAINNPYVKEIVQESHSTVVSYGFENADYTAENISYGMTSCFNVMYRNKNIGRFETSLLGKHNIENCLGVIAICLEKKILDVLQLQESLKNFKGIVSRLDKKSELTKIPIYEGFGSSYTKAKTALEALLLHFPDKKIITIFEPHTFGWRNKNNLHWYSDVFSGSHEVLVYQPPIHGANSHEQITQSEIIDTLHKNNQPAYPITSENETFKYLKNILNTDCIILLLTSGDLDGVTENIPKFCESIFPI
jgi:UDP-N-acetylmuramate: L-alanyl-gamma-D-glutamyl-meso-diaminopimelate ligase